MVMERSRCRGGADEELRRTCTSDGSGNNAKQSANFVFEIEWEPCFCVIESIKILKQEYSDRHAKWREERIDGR